MYGCESWTIKEAECRRIDAFELWCWRRLLRGPLDCKEIHPVHPKGDQSWVFIGRTDLEAEAPIWCKELPHWKRPRCWERLKVGGDGDNRGGDGWMASATQWTWVWVSSGCWWWTGKPDVLQYMGLQRVGHDWATELYSWFTMILVSCVQQSDSDIYLSFSIDMLFHILSPYSLLQNTDYSFLCHIIGPCCLPILHIVNVYMLIPNF